MKNTSNKEQGLYFTPEWIVELMVSMIDIAQKPNHLLNILEPACGRLQFIRKYVENNSQNPSLRKIIGVEIDPKIVELIETEGRLSEVQVINDDYLLWENDIKFDIIIGNPPYGIPSPNEHYSIRIDNETKSKYKDLHETWYGKYNLYGAFIEKSIKMLNNGGQLLFIVPATFIMLDEFKLLRQFLSEKGQTKLLYMGNGVFKPEADVVTLILDFKNEERTKNKLELWEYNQNKAKLNYATDKWKGEVITFVSKYILEMKSKCSYVLGDIYDIKVSPRTTEIKGKEIAFSDKVEGENCIPILNSKNLKRRHIIYENLSGYSIPKTKVKSFRGYYGQPHIVVGLGFRGSKKLASAFDERSYPWMGDVYHLLRKNDMFLSNDLNDLSVSDYLNSKYVAKYINDAFKDVTYHFSITQLKMIPLPTSAELRKIKEIYDESEILIGEQASAISKSS